LRADIDYGLYEARTTFGRIGVKCWINKGEVMPEGYRTAESLESERDRQQDRPPPRRRRENRPPGGGQQGRGGQRGGGGR
jgi:small subunit ribosomal protein S3